MIAQLSQSEPRGSPSSSIIGVRCAGSLRRKSGSRVLPQTSSSSKSRPAARTNMRTVRLLTLGFSTFSLMAAIWLPPRFGLQTSVGIPGGALLRERLARARDEQLDRVRQVDLVDVGVAARDAQL